MNNKKDHTVGTVSY